MENKYICEVQSISDYQDIYWYMDYKGHIWRYRFENLEYKLRKIDSEFYGIHLEIRYGK